MPTIDHSTDWCDPEPERAVRISDPTIQAGSTGTSSGWVELPGTLPPSSITWTGTFDANASRIAALEQRAAETDKIIAQQNATIATLNALVAELLKGKAKK